MKKIVLLFVLMSFLLINCKGRFVSGQEFFVNPYAYKGKTITLRLLYIDNYTDGTKFISPEWDAPVPIRFENINSYKEKLSHKFYLVTFLCRYGSLYHGNYIIKFREY